MINNNSPSSDKSLVTEIVTGETNKYKINLNQESFQNVYVILQADNEFLEEYNNGKKIDCIDIQNEGYKDSENISDSKTLMNNGQKYPRIKNFIEYKILGSNKIFKSQIISRTCKASRKNSNWLNLRNLDDDTIASTD